MMSTNCTTAAHIMVVHIPTLPCDVLKIVARRLHDERALLVFALGPSSSCSVLPAAHFASGLLCAVCSALRLRTFT